MSYLESVRGLIAEHGHMVQYVGGDEAAGEAPFAYTVGLFPQFAFELAMSIPAPDVATTVLNTLADRVKRGVLQPAEGIVVKGALTNGYDLRLARVKAPRKLHVARAVNREMDCAWQALYPDRMGRFPGDGGYAISPGVQRLI